MATWLAVRTVGTFRRGWTYTSDQLGVLGRMAVKCGHIVRAEETPNYAEFVKTTVPMTPAPRKRRKKTADGEQSSAQPGDGATQGD